jgi:hypothetical protein
MNKIAGKIAVVLILVMLAGSFSGCLSYVMRSEPVLHRVIYGVVDFVFLPISLIALVVYLIITQEEAETQNYLAGLNNNLSPEHYSLFQKLNSLPETELTALIKTLYSIPEVERNSTMEKFTSLSENQLELLIKAYISLPESTVISSIEKIESLSEAELIYLLRNFNSLTETEIDSIIESINPKSETENAALAYYFDYSFEALEAEPVTIANAL